MVVTAIGVFVESGLKTKNFNKKFNTVLNILKFFIQLKQSSFPLMVAGIQHILLSLKLLFIY